MPGKGRGNVRIPDNGNENEGHRVQVSLPCKAWENVAEKNDVLDVIEGHSPVAFTSPCADTGGGDKTRR